MTAAGVTHVGTVADAAGDVVVLDTASGAVDVHVVTASGGGAAGPAVPLLLRVVERARSGGGRGDPRGAGSGPGSSSARSRALRSSSASRRPPRSLRGILTVGRDHVCVRDRDGVETFVPLAWVAWVRAADG
ncbi:MAG: hypothetical protein M5U14_03235 [Acidimicrobiia bacterium]|nr:hypothetical protein [Acidimicrobiia bacterium]